MVLRHYTREIAVKKSKQQRSQSGFYDLVGNSSKISGLVGQEILSQFSILLLEVKHHIEAVKNHYKHSNIEKNISNLL